MTTSFIENHDNVTIRYTNSDGIFEYTVHQGDDVVSKLCRGNLKEFIDLMQTGTVYERDDCVKLKREKPSISYKLYKNGIIPVKPITQEPKIDALQKLIIDLHLEQRMNQEKIEKKLEKIVSRIGKIEENLAKVEKLNTTTEEIQAKLSEFDTILKPIKENTDMIPDQFKRMKNILHPMRLDIEKMSAGEVKIQERNVSTIVDSSVITPIKEDLETLTNFVRPLKFEVDKLPTYFEKMQKSIQSVNESVLKIPGKLEEQKDNDKLSKEICDSMSANFSNISVRLENVSNSLKPIFEIVQENEKNCKKIYQEVEILPRNFTPISSQLSSIQNNVSFINSSMSQIGRNNDDIQFIKSKVTHMFDPKDWGLRRWGGSGYLDYTFDAKNSCR